MSSMQDTDINIKLTKMLVTKMTRRSKERKHMEIITTQWDIYRYTLDRSGFKKKAIISAWVKRKGFAEEAGMFRNSLSKPSICTVKWSWYFVAGTSVLQAYFSHSSRFLFPPSLPFLILFPFPSKEKAFLFKAFGQH